MYFFLCKNLSLCMGLLEYVKAKQIINYNNIAFTTSCSMTFCFVFDVLMKLNPIQVNITGGGPSQ